MASAWKIIKAHCLVCSSGSPTEVKECRVTRCTLHPYRFGYDPYKEKRVYTDEQREKLRTRLADSRAPKICAEILPQNEDLRSDE